MQPELPKNARIFSKNDNLFTKKRQLTELSRHVGSFGGKRRKTESITFRLESEILDNLRQEAKRKDISVNTLVSQIARQHTSWHSMAAYAGFISVRKPFITKVMESQDEEKIKSLASYVARSSNKDFILMLRGKYNIHSALDIVETWVRISGYSYTHNIENLDYSNRAHRFVIHHDMGRKWSLYLAELYKNLFEDFEVSNAQFGLTDTTLVFRVVVSVEDEDDSCRNNEVTSEERYRASSVSDV
jgi:predicted DNA-binding ribbon-helix-helix protein